MKLSQAHLFYLLLTVLLLSSLGLTIKEGFKPDVAQKPKTPPGAGSWGGVDPTGPPSGGLVPPGKVPPGALPGPDGASAQGISKGQVPKGNEDLYILKSAIVPPVCPKCPDIQVCPDKNSECPPCPPCGRCPKPAFKCQKVPDLKSSNTNYLPQPILTDFSQFSI